MLYFHLTMPQTTVLSAVLACIIPPALIWIRSPKVCSLIRRLYALGIVWITVAKRELKVLAGIRLTDTIAQLNLTPFWSYAKFDQADIRWQVYMNIFLFIPFGFMLPWCSEKLQRLWKVLLIAAALSILTEVAQYFFRIGLCETDDVIHNTLGAVIGYGYWRLLCHIQVHFRGKKK